MKSLRTLKIKIYHLIVILLFTYNNYSQESPFYQNDSIYRKNKVKEMKVSGVLKRIDFFNENGKLIKSNYDNLILDIYKYDAKGKMIEYSEKWRGRRKSNRNHIIKYSNNRVLNIKSYNNKGKLCRIINYKNLGKKRIIKWIGDKLHTTEFNYLDSLNVKSIGRPGSKNITEFKYKFNNNLIKEIIEYRNKIKWGTAIITYDKNQLVKKIIYHKIQTKDKYIKNYQYKYYK